MTIAQRRAVATNFAPRTGTERRACQCLGLHRSAVRDMPQDRGGDALRATLRA